jgi:hypothetical protein
MMEDPPSANEGRAFRWTIGLLVMLTAMTGFGALFVLRVPAENKDAMMFALGSIFGWAAAVVASEYGSTTTGRKVADSAIRGLERQNIAADERPAGTDRDPLKTEARITNPPDDAANVQDASRDVPPARDD